MEYEVICEELFEIFKNIPKGHSIDNEKGLVHLCDDFFFTRRSLKHITEKTNGDFLMKNIIELVTCPDELRRDSKKGRLILAKSVFEASGKVSGKYYATILEPKENGNLIIITIFPTDIKYLKRFEILWRTGVHKNGPSICIPTLL